MQFSSLAGQLRAYIKSNDKLRYGVVIVGGFLIDLIVALVAKRVWGVPLVWAASGGFFVASIFNYLAHEYWTFRDRGGRFSVQRLLDYLLVAVLTLSARWVVLGLFQGGEKSLAGDAALFLGAAIISLAVNYFFTKYIVFSLAGGRDGKNSILLVSTVLISVLVATISYLTANIMWISVVGAGGAVVILLIKTFLERGLKRKF